MLAIHLAAAEVFMATIVVYSSANCSYCERAKYLLQSKNQTYTEIRVDLDSQKREEMMARSGRKTVPQIFINNHHIGGCDDLYALEHAGKLDQLLAEDNQ